MVVDTGKYMKEGFLQEAGRASGQLKQLLYEIRDTMVRDR